MNIFYVCLTLFMFWEGHCRLALIQANTLLPEPMMTKFLDMHMLNYVPRSLWVKCFLDNKNNGIPTKICYGDFNNRFAICYVTICLLLTSWPWRHNINSNANLLLTHKRSWQTNESYTHRCPIAHRQSNIAMKEKQLRRFVQAQTSRSWAMQTMTIVPWYFIDKKGLTTASGFMTTDNEISNKFETIKLRPNNTIMLFQSTKTERKHNKYLVISSFYHAHYSCSSCHFRMHLKVFINSVGNWSIN